MRSRLRRRTRTTAFLLRLDEPGRWDLKSSRGPVKNIWQQWLSGRELVTSKSISAPHGMETRWTSNGMLWRWRIQLFLAPLLAIGTTTTVKDISQDNTPVSQSIRDGLFANFAPRSSQPSFVGMRYRHASGRFYLWEIYISVILYFYILSKKRFNSNLEWEKSKSTFITQKYSSYLLYKGKMY